MYLEPANSWCDPWRKTKDVGEVSVKHRIRFAEVPLLEQVTGFVKQPFHEASFAAY